MIQSMPDPSLAQPPQRKDLVTLASKICSLLPKTGNTNQITLFIFYDVCFGVTMGRYCGIMQREKEFISKMRQHRGCITGIYLLCMVV